MGPFRLSRGLDDDMAGLHQRQQRCNSGRAQRLCCAAVVVCVGGGEGRATPIIPGRQSSGDWGGVGRKEEVW